jgi:hypothetical protein
MTRFFYFALFFALILQTSVVGQFSTTIQLDWSKNQTYIVGQKTYIIPYFNNLSFYFEEGSKTIFSDQNIKIDGIANIESLRISQITYESIALNTSDIDGSKLSSSIKLSVKNVMARGENYLNIKFSPLIKDETGVKKVTSFKIDLDLSKAAAGSNLRSPYLGIQNSVLGNGQWFRFFVEKSGIYKISRSFLQSLGMQNIGDPRRLRVFSHGGKMAPMLNNANFPPDLPELAIQVIGEEDGSFDANDFILVYCEGVDNWAQEHETNNNLYSKGAFYYITNNSDIGKRITNFAEPSGTPTLTVNKADFQAFYEKDLTNIGRIGRRWFGEQFGLQNSHSMTINVPGIASDPVALSMVFANTSTSSNSVAITLNSANIGTANLNAIAGDNFYQLSSYINSIVASENFNFKLDFNNGGLPNARSFLDYITLTGKRNLAGIGKQYPFNLVDAINLSGVVEYQFSNASTVNSVWNITDIYNITKKDNNSGTFSFKDNLGLNKNYVVLSINDTYPPLKESNARVFNQNIKYQVFHNAQGQFEDIDYLIIAPVFLVSEAERLAQLHRNLNQLKVKVVPLELIYPEFSSGKQDIGAIRNFVRYIYENASTPDKRLKYLNLFGDTSFDYLDRVPANINTNIVPAFHAKNGTSTGGASYTSDDFFVLLDQNEGIDGFDNIFGLPDVAVGRMIVSSLQQAREMVNKVYEYEDYRSFNPWRNYVVGVSDDTLNGESGDEFYLQEGINNLINEISTQKPFINGTKVLMDAYQVQSTAGGLRYPEARRDFLRAFENGSLAIFYLGHGGIEGLSTERVFEKFDGSNVLNRFKYPVFITITCEFTRYDNPYSPSSGEYTFWNPTGGAIAMITTTRDFPGGSTATNATSNTASKLFNFGSNERVSMAEALRQVKLTQMSLFRVVSFLGCPALKLAIPEPKIVLTKINDLPASGSNLTFQALSTYTIEGEVRDETGTNLLSNYNGEVAIRIFDKNIQRQTLNNRGNSTILNFQTLGETIFRGNATAANGVFRMTFVVPRDIKIPIGNGRISFYAKSNNPTLQDQTGWNTDILVGGVNPNPPVDNTPPTCQLFMNDESFVNGGITNRNPILIGVFEDENGINTAAGIGHDMVAILDGDETNPYILNDYYETELDNHRKGRIRFPFRNLTPGLHTIKVTVWDVYNNPTTCEIQFLVTDGENLSLTNVLNYPNPFVNYTQFWFTHDRPFEPLNVQVQIFTISGKVVKTINQTVTTEGFLSRDITWDGKDDFGDKIGKGVYVYKLTVEATLSNKKAEKIEKLVIL